MKAISRKDFIHTFFRVLSPATQDPEINGLGILLPPGTKNPDHFTHTCQKNYDCISKCPYEALRVYRENTRSEFYGFPVIIPETQACLNCPDFPCIEACESGALNIEFKLRALGTARIIPDLCLAYSGNFCQSCVTNCPSNINAILKDENNMPEIKPERCTGCGICVQVCPAEPRAIQIKINQI